MLTFTLLRLAFVFAVADLTHAVTLIGTGVAPASRDYRHLLLASVVREACRAMIRQVTEGGRIA